MATNQFITIAALNRYLKAKTDKDIHLQRLFLKGEIKDFKLSGSNLYFTLTDEEAAIRGMMFKNYSCNLSFLPKDGDVVIAEGTLSFYVKSGSYTFITYNMLRYGQGDAHQAFLALKEKLDKEGLLSLDIKKPLPRAIRHIGIVTSPTGDAIHDIISTINRRFPFIDAVIYPAKVQGEGCPESLMGALLKAYDNPDLDVIIIARGGGSDEDLNGFNDEMLARTIRLSPIPVVSGVGHEADITICDLVSDLRAPTPTGAAMLITPNKDDILMRIKQDEIHAHQAFTQYINQIELHLKQSELKLTQLNPQTSLNDYMTRLIRLKTQLNQKDILSCYKNRLETACINLSHALNLSPYLYRLEYNKRQLTYAYTHLMDGYLHILSLKKMALESSSPLAILDKGYVLVEQNDHFISDVDDLTKNSMVLHFKDGVAQIEMAHLDKIKRNSNNQ